MVLASLFEDPLYGGVFSHRGAAVFTIMPNLETTISDSRLFFKHGRGDGGKVAMYPVGQLHEKM